MIKGHLQILQMPVYLSSSKYFPIDEMLIKTKKGCKLFQLKNVNKDYLLEEWNLSIINWQPGRNEYNFYGHAVIVPHSIRMEQKYQSIFWAGRYSTFPFFIQSFKFKVQYSFTFARLELFTSELRMVPTFYSLLFMIGTMGCDNCRFLSINTIFILVLHSFLKHINKSESKSQWLLCTNFYFLRENFTDCHPFF